MKYALLIMFGAFYTTTACVWFLHSPVVSDLQGFLEQTYLFYGYYKVEKIHFPHITYNLALAYLLATVAYLFLSLIWIVKRYGKVKNDKSLKGIGRLLTVYC